MGALLLSVAVWRLSRVWLPASLGDARRPSRRWVKPSRPLEGFGEVRDGSSQGIVCGARSRRPSPERGIAASTLMPLEPTIAPVLTVVVGTR